MGSGASEPQGSRPAAGQGKYRDRSIYDAGFNANSRFYEASNQVLGMTPTAFRRGGRDVDIRFAVAESRLGAIWGPGPTRTSAPAIAFVVMSQTDDLCRPGANPNSPERRCAKSAPSRAVLGFTGMS